MGQVIAEDVNQFGSLHMEIYKITNVAKYRSFQYRLLQRGIVTNIQLERWGLRPDNLCTFCKEEKETILHIFCECRHTLALWKRVAYMLRDNYGDVDIELSPKSIITGNISKLKVSKFICLLTKQFRYKQRCLKLTIDFPILKTHINRIENIEKYIAIKNDKLKLHLEKWKAYNGDD